MTFINEGNPNYMEKLVNFEKMVSPEYQLLSITYGADPGLLALLQRMIAKTVKVVRGCRSQPYSE